MYRMPAEYEPHRATLMIWPVRPAAGGRTPALHRMPLCGCLRPSPKARTSICWPARNSWNRPRAATAHLDQNRLHLLCIDSDDAWARDVGPTFVKNESGELKGISWRFNAWGGEVDGLYADWQKDDAVASAFCEAAGLPWEDAAPFVLEGGSIHTDGEGTALVTESCLLSAGRNPSMSRQEIEAELCRRLGIQKVLWLPRGIYNDETNEHVDNVCAFVGPAEVVLAWTDDPSDPQYPLSAADLAYLESVTDAKGRKLTVHKLPSRTTPSCAARPTVTPTSLPRARMVREPGERLAASYVNFYFTNDAVLVPQFGGENAASDTRACAILQALCPGRRVIGLPARGHSAGRGNIHCITQQIPR